MVSRLPAAEQPVGSPAIESLSASVGTGSGRTTGWALAVLAVVSLLSALAFFLYARRFRGATDATAALGRIRRAFRVGLPTVYVVALVAMGGFGWPDTVESLVAAVSGSESAVGTGLRIAGTLTPPAVAVLAGYFGAFPAVRALRDVDVSATTVAVRLARYVAVMVTLLTVAAVLLTAVAGSLGIGIGFVGAVSVLLAGFWGGSPWLIRLFQSTRPPTDAERERLDRLCRGVEFAPAEVRVLDVADAKQAFATVRGVPGRRHLFVTDYLLAELDDDLLGGYLALQAGRAHVKHLETKLGVVLGTIALAVSLLLGTVPAPGVSPGVAALAVLAVGAVALRAGQRLVYRADADAADRTGRETVEETIRRFADLNDVPMEWGRLAAFRRMEASLTRRIDRLRDRASRE